MHIYAKYCINIQFAMRLYAKHLRISEKNANIALITEFDNYSR